LRALNDTLEQRVSEALAERSLFAEFVNNTDDAVLALDFGFNILAINKANTRMLERIYGVAPRAGDNLLQIMNDLPELRAQIDNLIRRALSGEEFTVTEELGDPNRQRLHFEIRFTTLRDRQGERVGALQVAHDITERVRSQSELAATQDALRQAQKMEAVGQLTGGLAHDFNNILAGISGGLELAHNRIIQGRFADVDKYLSAAQGATKRVAALTHRLLAFPVVRHLPQSRPMSAG
jgi:PAS domain S-box-containing protein